MNLVQLAEDGSNNQKFVLTPRATSAVPEGIYFFKNAELKNYMRIDDDESVTTESAKFELRKFDGADYQKWEIDYTADGYYRILSVASGKAVTAPPSGNDKNITQTVYTGGDNQWWIITVTDNGLYNLSPKSNPSYRMAASFGIIDPNGRNVELRDPQTDNLDEWQLYKTILQSWNSDSDAVSYWSNNPSLYTEKIDTSSTFYFNNGINSAKDQWEDALNIDYLPGSANSANIKCYGATKQYFETFMGVEFDSTTVGLTSWSFYNESTTYWGDSCIYINKMANATIYILSLDYDNSTQKDIVVHEFGHAMGYHGHSQIQNNVMYPYCHSDYTLKPEEIAHLKQFYN